MPKRPAVPSSGMLIPVLLGWARRPQTWGLALGLVGVLSALSLLHIIRGALGGGLVNFWRNTFGWGAYLIVAILLAAAAWLLAPQHLQGRLGIRPSQILGLELLLIGCLALIHTPLPASEGYALAAQGQGGGYLGWAVASFLTGALGRLLGGLVLILVAIGGASLAFDVPWGLLPALADRVLATLEAHLAPTGAHKAEALAAAPGQRPVTRRPEPARAPSAAGSRPQPPPPSQPRSPAAPAPSPPRRRARSRGLPPLDILAPPAGQAADDATTRQQAQVIEQTLAHFGVPATVVETQRGPAVTLFGLEPGFTERKTTSGLTVQRKVRVSRIEALSNDLALALAVPSLRIEAPMPGRPLVGIEVPNTKPSLVNLRSVIESDVYRRIASPLRIALGQGASGRPVAADLAAMPHLLIAGATGSGKSVCINALIACLLMENPPEALNLILIDPKRVELTGYNGVPHLIAPVIVEVEQTVGALRWLCLEMDRRYKAFARLKVRNIEGYNAAVSRQRSERLPYLAVFVDELADLMMVAPDDVERSLCRLAQMGRATGIHLIIATQRPSVDVLTGLIKANFPARIAFAVSTQIDSRVILDTGGAEQLLGRGDMLFMSPEASRLLRLQGCFVSDSELAAIVAHWRAAPAEAAEGEQMETTAPWEGLLAEEDEEDRLYQQAVELVRRQGQASASLLQRRLRVGYSRAARLIEQLEAAGIVGPDPGGGRPRPVLIETERDSGEPVDEG